MKGIGAIAHTGVPSCINEMDCWRVNWGMATVNLDGFNLNHSFSSLKNLGAGESDDEDVSGLSGQSLASIFAGVDRNLNLNML